jgi:hypothetical protein
MARALTDRQLAVHAALERLGSPTLPELVDELQRFGPAQLGLPIVQHPDGTVETIEAPAPPRRPAPSAIWRVVEALARCGLVTLSGMPMWRYLGEPPPGFPHPVAPSEVVRVRPVRRNR